MKKGLLFLLLMIYALSIFGIAFSEFYCCGKLKSITVSYHSNEKGCKEDSKTDDCCKTKVHYFKVDDKHLNAGHLVVSTPWLAEMHYTPYDFHGKELALQTTYSNSPPRDSGIPLYLTYRILRI